MLKFMNKTKSFKINFRISVTMKYSLISLKVPKKFQNIPTKIPKYVSEIVLKTNQICKRKGINYRGKTHLKKIKMIIYLTNTPKDILEIIQRSRHYLIIENKENKKK